MWAARRRFNLVSITHGHLSVPGLYIFWRKRNCIYIGISANIQKRLLQHYQKCHNPCLRAWIESDYSLEFTFFEVADKAQRHLREIHLIKNYDPCCNDIYAAN